jgi:hypothetical protein
MDEIETWFGIIMRQATLGSVRRLFLEDFTAHLGYKCRFSVLFARGV